MMPRFVKTGVHAYGLLHFSTHRQNLPAKVVFPVRILPTSYRQSWGGNSRGLVLIPNFGDDSCLPWAHLTPRVSLHNNLGMYPNMENPISTPVSAWFFAATLLIVGCGPLGEDLSSQQGQQTPVPPAAPEPTAGRKTGSTTPDPRIRELESLDAVSMVRTDSAGRIKRIDFNRRLITDDTLAELRGLEDLDYLDLVEAHITDEGLRHLADLPGLETLFLSSTAVTDAGLKHVSQIESLQTLYLITTEITDQGLAHLTSLQKLEELYVGETGITDAGVPLLTKLPRLTVLDISATPITDQGVAQLAQLPQLRTVYIDRTEATPEAIAQLRRALPDADVYDEPSKSD